MLFEIKFSQMRDISQLDDWKGQFASTFSKQTMFLVTKVLKMTNFFYIYFQTLWHKYLGPVEATGHDDLNRSF